MLQCFAMKYCFLTFNSHRKHMRPSVSLTASQLVTNYLQKPIDYSLSVLCCTVGAANHTIIRAAFVCVFVCLCVSYLFRGPLADLRQTWWVYVGGPPIYPWGVLFWKGQRVDGSTGHFHFPLYYICASLTPHSCKRRLLLCCCCCRV